uniref:Uncharacterized protein n=1 Tax=Anguilla anguilla TaxID=7936 RepID=A0A0E9UG93_ANGAN
MHIAVFICLLIRQTKINDICGLILDSYSFRMLIHWYRKPLIPSSEVGNCKKESYLIIK